MVESVSELVGLSIKIQSIGSLSKRIVVTSLLLSGNKIKGHCLE